MKREYKYESGTKAERNFERAMKKLFKAPKTVRVGGASGTRKNAKKSEREGKGE